MVTSKILSKRQYLLHRVTLTCCCILFATCENAASSQERGLCLVAPFPSDPKMSPLLFIRYLGKNPQANPWVEPKAFAWIIWFWKIQNRDLILFAGTFAVYVLVYPKVRNVSICPPSKYRSYFGPRKISWARCVLCALLRAPNLSFVPNHNK